MTDQVRISDDGSLEIERQSCSQCGCARQQQGCVQCGDGPRTWDGEPLYSPSTVQEGLFAGDAFEQMPGQLPIEEPPEYRRIGGTWGSFKDKL